MRILVLSDIHGRTDGLDRLADRSGPVDLLIASGDLTHFGNLDDARRIIGELKKINSELMAIAGNCDNREIEEMLIRDGLAPEAEGFKIRGVRLIGLSGALPGPVRTPYERSEKDFEEALSSMGKTMPGRDAARRRDPECLVLVSHQPPHGSVADRVAHFKHVGSHAIRNWVEKHTPSLVISGHIHESHGHELEGRTHVVNPGAFKDGRYALVDIDGTSGEVSVRLEKLK